MQTLQTYRSLETLRVADAMHPGLISCSPDMPLRAVARMMATYRIHAILVASHGEEELPAAGGWGIVSDTDLLRAAEREDVDELQAGAIAETPVLTVTPAEELARAAALMVEHGATHLVVAEPRTARPLGVLSTLDVARALARFPETHPAHQRA